MRFEEGDVYASGDSLTVKMKQIKNPSMNPSKHWNHPFHIPTIDKKETNIYDIFYYKIRYLPSSYALLCTKFIRIFVIYILNSNFACFIEAQNLRFFKILKSTLIVTFSILFIKVKCYTVTFNLNYMYLYLTIENATRLCVKN